jgi:hypothetical protein
LPRGEQESADPGAGRLYAAKLGRLRFGARERPRGYFSEKTAAAHPHDFGRPDGQPGDQPLEHPVEAVDLGRAGATREPEHDPPRDMPEEQQIARVDRHPEMLDPATRSDDRRGNDVSPIEDRRGAVNQQNVDALAERIADHRCQFTRRVRAPLLEHEPAAERGEPAFGHLPGLVENALLEPGKARLHKPDRARHKWSNAQQGTVRRRDLDAARDRRFRCCERDDLDRGDHLLGLDRREWRQSAERHRLVDQVEPVEPFRVEHQKSSRLGEEVGAAREGGRRFDLRPGCGRSDPPGRLVLADVAGFEPGDHDPRQA